ncbi:hypothetical protein BC828DRAFT_392205 [Blastocladiella britannica]|nr:hypothetical protein BC828DRAFT_392205 [Blastocladiella britannica]
MMAVAEIDKPCAEGLQCVANQCVGVDPPKSSSTSTSSSPATSSSTTGSTLSTSTSSTTSSTPTSALNDPLASSTDANPLLYILGAACFILLVTTLGCWARRRPVRILVAGPKPTAAPASRPQPATAPVAAPPPAQLPVSTAQYGSPIVEQVEYVTVGRLAVPEPLQPVAMPQPVRGYPPAVPPPVAVPHPAAGVGGTVPAVMSFALSQTAAAATEPQEVIADPMRLPSTVPRTDGDDLVLPSGR